MDAGLAIVSGTIIVIVKQLCYNSVRVENVVEQDVHNYILNDLYAVTCSHYNSSINN